MDNRSPEIGYARDILSTYRQVNDAPLQQKRINHLKVQQKNRELETELQSLKEKYYLLQTELNNREESLARLSRQLIERTTYMTKLEEDFENAIYQMKQRR